MDTVAERPRIEHIAEHDTKGACPCCGSKNIRRIRRITGYFSTADRFNEGKKAELRDRVNHI